MTALLSGVVVVLVVCHTPKTVINLYECYQVNTANLKQETQLTELFKRFINRFNLAMYITYNIYINVEL